MDGTPSIKASKSRTHAVWDQGPLKIWMEQFPQFHITKLWGWAQEGLQDTLGGFFGP